MNLLLSLLIVPTFLLTSGSVMAQDEQTVLEIKSIRDNWAQNLQALSNFAKRSDHLPAARNAGNGFFRDIVCRSGFDCIEKSSSNEVSELIKLHKDFFKSLVGIFTQNSNQGADHRWEKGEDGSYHEKTRPSDYELNILFENPIDDLLAISNSITKNIESEKVRKEVQKKMKKEIETLISQVPIKFTYSGKHLNPQINIAISQLIEKKLETLKTLSLKAHKNNSLLIEKIELSLYTIFSKIKDLSNSYESTYPWTSGDYQLGLIIILDSGVNVLNNIDL